MSSLALDEIDEEDQEEPPLYAEAIYRLYNKGATGPLTRIIGRLLPADIAQVINSARDPKEAMDLFELVTDPKEAGATIKEVDEELQHHILNHLPVETAVPILESLPPDTRSQLIGSLSPILGERLMSAMRLDTKEEVEELLQYLPETAGSLMNSRFFAVLESSTAGDCILALRGLASYELVFYVYVYDEVNRLTGVTSLRQLILAPPDKPVKEIMNTRVHRVNVNTPQDEVAKEVTVHHLLAIPVVDDTGELCGIVTVDDLIHVIQDADTQAMIKQATGRSGDSKLNIMTKHFVEVARGRLPWLAVPFLGGLAAAYILSYFEHTMAAVIQLSFFMPMIFGMAGNVGSQAATVAVRGLATRTIHVRDWARLLFKEISVGMLIGGFYALCLSSYAYLVFDSSTLAFVVGISILSNITYAGVIAASLPLLIQRLGHDPAIGGGPYVLTAIDVLGVINYLFIATTVYQL